MKKTIIYALIIVLAGVVAGIYYYQKSSEKKLANINQVNNNLPVKEQPIENKTQTDSQTQQLAASTTSDGRGQNNAVANKVPNKPVQGTYSSGEDAESAGPDIMVEQINYDGIKFTPSSVNIKAGDVVVFKNNSGKDFWPASGPHPTHTAYPEFDAKKPIAPGGKYQFQFAKVGNWSFHDHLNETAMGVVNVSK